jgi:hypothetical protein
MSYNKTSRRRFTKAQRAAFLLLHKSTCYWCREPILEGEPWAVEHLIARELMAGKDADADDNLKPIHAHPKPCHKTKTALDVKMIAKSNRLRREAGPVEDRRKRTKIPRPANGGWSKGKTKWPKRKMGS